MRTATMPKYRVGRNNEYTPVNKKDQLLRFANTKTGSGFIEYIKIHYLSVNGTGIPVRYNQAGNPVKNEFCKIRQKEYEKNIMNNNIFFIFFLSNFTELIFNWIACLIISNRNTSTINRKVMNFYIFYKTTSSLCVCKSQ